MKQYVFPVPEVRAKLKEPKFMEVIFQALPLYRTCDVEQNYALTALAQSDPLNRANMLWQLLGRTGLSVHTLAYLCQVTPGTIFKHTRGKRHWAYCRGTGLIVYSGVQNACLAREAKEDLRRVSSQLYHGAATWKALTALWKSSNSHPEKMRGFTGMKWNSPITLPVWTALKAVARMELNT
jgi:hypothetical protein